MQASQRIQPEFLAERRNARVRLALNVAGLSNTACV